MSLSLLALLLSFSFFCLLLFSCSPVLYAFPDAFIPDPEKCRFRNGKEEADKSSLEREGGVPAVGQGCRLVLDAGPDRFDRLRLAMVGGCLADNMSTVLLGNGIDGPGRLSNEGFDMRLNVFLPRVIRDVPLLFIQPRLDIKPVSPLSEVLQLGIACWFGYRLVKVVRCTIQMNTAVLQAHALQILADTSEETAEQKSGEITVVDV